MKLHLKNSINIGTGILLTVFVLFFIITPADNRKNDIESLKRYTENQVLNDLDTSAEVKSYLKIKDSITPIIAWRDLQLRNGAGTYNIFFGIRRIDECDSCNAIKPQSNDYSKKYFIELGDFSLKDDTKFLIEKGRYYLITPKKQKNSFGVGEQVYEKKEIPVRLVLPFFEAKKMSLLLPISERTGKILTTINNILLILTLIFGLYIFIVLPIRIIANISRGNPFKESNHKNLKTIGLTILIITAIKIIAPKLIELFMRPVITKDIYNPLLLSIFDMKYAIVSGIATLLLANAFKKGYFLQTDKDLTI